MPTPLPVGTQTQLEVYDCSYNVFLPHETGSSLRKRAIVNADQATLVQKNIHPSFYKNNQANPWSCRQAVQIDCFCLLIFVYKTKENPRGLNLSH